MAGRISMAARREVVSAVAERYRPAKRAEKGRILDELCATTGWHRKHAVRALRQRETVMPGEVEASRERRRRYGATIKDALTALWEASDRVCGKRLKVMIPTLLPALERNGRLKLDEPDRDRVLAVSAATVDRLLGDVKVAASGGKRRRAGFYSAIRREVPIRTFNDWNSPPPGFCEVDMVAHGGTSVAGSFIQTLTMVDVATGWTECLPLVTRESGLVVEAMARAQSLFPWLIVGADFDNDSAFMNDIVVPWCRTQKIEVTRSRGLGPLRWLRDGEPNRPPLCRCPASRELLPAVIQAEGQAAGRRKGDQALPRSGYALRACAGASESRQGGQAASARDLSHARSRGASGRGACRPDRTRHTRRSPGDERRRRSRPQTTTGAGCGEVREGAWQDDRSRRAACHASAHQATLQDASSHALNARSASGRHRELACRRASADRDRHPRPAWQTGAGGVRPTATRNRPEAAQDAEDQGRASVDRRQSGSR